LWLRFLARLVRYGKYEGRRAHTLGCTVIAYRKSARPVLSFNLLSVAAKNVTPILAGMTYEATLAGCEHTNLRQQGLPELRNPWAQRLKIV
jgi:hypothetical protein